MKTATRYLEAHMVRDLATVTDGRYRRVRVDDKTLDIEVHAPEKGDWVPVSSLSQGTLDLVYLVARLGLVRLVTGDRRPPLVFDDPFVTLDDARAARALDAAQGDRVRLPGHLPDDVATLRRRRPTPWSCCPVRPSVDDGAEDPSDAAPIAGARPERPDRARRRPRPSSSVSLSAVAWGCGDFGGGLLAGGRRSSASSWSRSSSGWCWRPGDRARAGETAPLPIDLSWSVLVRVVRWDRDHRALPRPGGRADGRRRAGHRRSSPRSSRSSAGIVTRGRSRRRSSLVGIGLAIVAVVLVSRVRDDGRAARPVCASRSSRASRSALFSVSIAQISEAMRSARWLVIRARRGAC